MSFVEFKEVTKTYTMGSVKVHAVHNMNFSIEEGEICVIVGPSGAGKTTVLNMDNFPAQLSGGEQQRVSIARALAKNPRLLLCDEPTGALDYKTGKQILKLLQDMCKEQHKTVAIVTHNFAFTQIADRVIHVKEGQAQSVEINQHPVDALTVEW